MPVMPRVSVVIPNYQGENYIEACLSSLLQQEAAYFVIRIVENGSTDRSREKLVDFLTENGYRMEESTENTKNEGKEWKRYLSSNPAVPEIRIFYHTENTGFCHAVNQGIVDSGEEFVFLLNNDTTLDTGCIRKLTEFMDRHPKAFSAGAKMVSMQEPDIADDCGDYFNALGYAFAAGKGKKSDCYLKEKQVFSACGGAAVYRRELFSRIGLFDENHFAYLEDVDIGYRAGIYGYRNYFVPSAVVYHAGSAVSGSRHNAFKVKLSSRNSVYLVYKNEPLLQWLLNLPFLILGCLVKTLFFSVKGLGGIYFRGILKGLAFCFTKEARAHKVRFRMKNLGNYVKIQWKLWINIFRMIL